MAHKKGGGSSTNGRDSNAQRLGVKAFAGELVTGGSMQIVNQTIPRALTKLGYENERAEAIIEHIAEHGNVIEFNDVLAVSAQEGHIGPGQGAVVSGEVVDSGRHDKILVFHFKRKKQYKKMQGHRQNFTEVRIKAIEADGVTYTAEK